MKTNYKNRILSLVISLLMVISLIPPSTLSAFASSEISGTCGEQLSWELNLNDDGTTYTLIISGSGDMEDYIDDVYAPWYDYCNSITNVILPDGLTSIGNSAFYELSVLSNITIPEGVTEIDEWAFSESGLTGIDIPYGVTCIGKGAFQRCNKLTSAVIPDSVTTLDKQIFNDCFNLTEVTLPDTITTISKSMFSGCSALANITIPDSVTSIGDGAFTMCMALTSITIPENVTSIGTEAFCGCNALTSITIPEKVAFIGVRGFVSCDNLTAIEVDSDNSNYKSVDGVLFTKDGSTLIAYPGGKAGGYSIPDGVTIIGNYAFYGSKINNIEITDSVTNIDNYSFCRCSNLVDVDIPDSVTNIGNSAFGHCSSLICVEIPDSVTSIGQSAFVDCSSLISVEIPDSVTSISNYTFRECSSLISVEIPDSVTSIGYSAFADCPNLYLHYFGTEKQWNSISKESSATSNIKGIHCVGTTATWVFDEGGSTHSWYCSQCNTILETEEHSDNDGPTYKINEADNSKHYVIYDCCTGTEVHKPVKNSYIGNGDGTHNYTCSDCGTVSEACSGGKATCILQSNCELCSTAYGELDAENHTAEVLTEYEWGASGYGDTYVKATFICSGCDEVLHNDNGYAELAETIQGTDCLNPGYELYKITFTYDDKEYTGTKKFTVKNYNHAGECINGFCSECGGYEPAKLNDNGTPDEEYDDYYEISNAGQLYWFREVAVDNDNYSSAVLTDDIIVNEDLTAENLREWIPIGVSSSMPYCGSFDGQGHSISGLYAKSELNYIGLFGAIGWGAEISNLGIKDSYFEGNYYVGGIVGYCESSCVINCYTEDVEVVAVSSGGALVGYNYGEISNSYSTSDSIVGNNNYGTITNCYYLADEETDSDDGTTAKNADAFVSGEVAYLLQAGVVGEPKVDEDGNYIYDEDGNFVYDTENVPHVWGQKIGTDSYPVLGGDKVYEVSGCEENTLYSNTNENGQHSYKDGICSICGDSQLKNGIYEEDGALYYYKDGVKNYAGLIMIDGYYYYVNSSCKVIAGKGYYVSKTNLLLPSASYKFDETGKMINPPAVEPDDEIKEDTVKNGLIRENSALVYYVDGVKTYGGLIKIGEDYYYVNSSCKVIVGKAYYVSKTNNLMERGSYTFDANGKMVR